MILIDRMGNRRQFTISIVVRFEHFLFWPICVLVILQCLACKVSFLCNFRLIFLNPLQLLTSYLSSRFLPPEIQNSVFQRSIFFLVVWIGLAGLFFFAT